MMSDWEPLLLAAPFVLYAVGALLALGDWGGSGRLSHGAALAGSLTGAGAALRWLAAGAHLEGRLWQAAPYAEFTFRIDPLASFFLLVIFLIAAACSLYAIGYLEHEHGGPALGLGLNGFLASMGLVVLADNVFAFLFTWECMSLTSFFLVMHDHHQASNRRAGYIYLVMTHASAAFLFISLLWLASAAGSLNFAGLRGAGPSLPPWLRDAVFLLALVGFGTKAGIIPLHIWLPLAHPAAPSYISALMSGVMIKTGIYGLIRVGWEFAAPGPGWWGWLVLALGAVSAVMGVLYALMEHDLKRLLAFHSIENIGIILIGVGAALVFSAAGQPGPAALALTAALFHVFNHAVFKALLFLGAGAIQQAAGTRDLEHLGGLIRGMPWTAGAFLVGAAAISALPPLNGFVSEWLTFQSLLVLASSASDFSGAAGGAAAAGLLALTGGLAAFCFVKAFGVAFLGIPRSAGASKAMEPPGSMVWGMAVLALLCVMLGLGGAAVVRLLAPVTLALTGAAAAPSLGLFSAATSPTATLAPAGALLAVALLGALGLALARGLGGPGRERVAPPWVCGMALEPRMQYSAAALAKPVRIIFGAILRPTREITRELALAGSGHPGAPYFVAGIRYEAGLKPVYERALYRPVIEKLMRGARSVRAFQNGSLRLYLAAMFATLVALLLLAR